MADFYTAAQIDAMAPIIAQRINNRTTSGAIQAAYEANADTNRFTDAEKAKLAGLEGSRYVGTFDALADIPTDGAVPGAYAYYNEGSAKDTKFAVYDADDNKWVSRGNVSAETPASIVVKVGDAVDANLVTDAQLQKLDELDLQVAPDITTFTAALDAALAA